MFFTVSRADRVKILKELLVNAKRDYMKRRIEYEQEVQKILVNIKHKAQKLIDIEDARLLMVQRRRSSVGMHLQGRTSMRSSARARAGLARP